MFEIKPAAYEPPPRIKGMKVAPHHLEITNIIINELTSLIKHGNETKAHNLLIKYPNLLYFLMNNTGHHGTWYTSKPQICPPLINGRKGKIPDFLIAGANSDGIQWFVVELKSPKDKLFNEKGDCFSSIANKGLNQLAGYLKFCTEHQNTLRDTYGIQDFTTPNGILVIGNEEETRLKEKQDLKAFWNNSLPKIKIISYSRILNLAQEILHFRNRDLEIK